MAELDLPPPTTTRPTVLIALGVFALLGGLVSFLGWAADNARLTDWFNNGISIQPNATIAVTCAGAALLFLAWDRGTPVAVLGAIVCFFGASAFLQYLVRVDFPTLNTAFMFHRTWGRGGVISPGRMGPPGAFCWTVMGGALVLLGLRRRRAARAAVPFLALITLAIAALAITGYLYRASMFYSAPYLTVIALQTALFIAAVSLGLIVSVPDIGPMRLLNDGGAAGVVARRATPTIILVAFIVGLVRLAGESAGWFDTATGTAARTIVEIILLLSLLSWSLFTIRRHERVLRDSRRRLADADQRKDEFLATLAHELRGPLAPLRNTLEILNRTNSGGSLEQQARGTMERQLKHLVRLVDDLMDVSRITHGKIELRRERVELKRSIEQALESMQPVAAQRDIRLRVHDSADRLLVHADLVRMTQVFGNLLNNACKYTEPGGEVVVTIERWPRQAVVSIKDTGVGIPADQLHRIFELFTQVDPPFEREQGGLGIGLTLVKQLVEMHGGTVSANSAGVGRGSEFVVRLPLADEEPRLRHDREHHPDQNQAATHSLRER